MGFRFRRSFKVAPGFRLNLQQVGVSTSAGRRGLWFTIGPRGTRTTVGIPGTWVEPHGTIEVAQSRRAGRQQHRHASDAAIRCIGLTIRNANVERPDA